MTVSKYEAKRAKGPVRRVVPVAVLVLLAAALLLFLMPQVLYRLSGEADDSAPSAASVQSANQLPTPALTFPAVLADGRLEVQSVFQFSGINPDCGNRECTDAASLTVKNLSDTHLERAEITLTAGPDQVLHFVVTELPAGKVSMVFSQENASVEMDAVYSGLTCDAVFNADASLQEDVVAVSVDGTRITLQNKTDTEIAQLVVYCRSTLGDQYFGGVTYPYTVNRLSAYGTAELDAVDCILGMAEVVRIAIHEP